MDKYQLINYVINMATYTLTYTMNSGVDGRGGWPSFYSFAPEFMIGMNSYFYTFSGGNIFRHNTNDNRNEYYEVAGNLAPSSITSVFNPRPIKDIKLFKTMSFESNAAWSCTQLATDLSAGSMLGTYFEQKEGEWFTFIRNNEGTINWRERSANGIGPCASVQGPTAATIVGFNSPVGSIISIGDLAYKGTTTPVLAGTVTAIDNTAPNFSITINATLPAVAPVQGDFIAYIKNSVAESHGARGYYMEFTLSNALTSAVELYSVGSSVMKSYP